MTRGSRWLVFLGGAMGAGLGCDPNVVIGTRWRLDDEPSAGLGGGGLGSSGSGTVTVSGSGGTELPSEGGTNDMPVVVGGEAGLRGDAGQAGAGSIYFEADHETGSLAVWDDGPDPDAGGYYADGSNPTYSEKQAHSGQGSAVATIDTSTGTAPISRLYRRVLADQAYYSAWFYLAEDHTPSQWWSIFLFRAHEERAQSIDLWDVDLIRVDGHLSLSVYDHQRAKVIPVPSKPTIPVGQWFQIEAFLSLGAGEPSRLDYWLDGEPILSLTDLNARPANEPVYWVVGNGASTLTPPVSTVYVDDATVSAQRVGAP